MTAVRTYGTHLSEIRWTWHLPLRGLPQHHRASPSAALDERLFNYGFDSSMNSATLSTKD